MVFKGGTDTGYSIQPCMFECRVPLTLTANRHKTAVYPAGIRAAGATSVG
jgi:hypothetical protein